MSELTKQKTDSLDLANTWAKQMLVCCKMMEDGMESGETESKPNKFNICQDNIHNLADALDDNFKTYGGWEQWYEQQNQQ